MSAVAKLVAAFAAGLALAWGLTSCGSGGSGTLAQQVKSAAATAAGQVTGGTRTTPASAPTQPTTTATEAQTTTTTPPKPVTTPKTQTVTTPPKTVTQPPKTVTTTQTVTQEGHNAATAVGVTPTSTTGDGESGSGMPWWGWVLIVGGAAAAGIAGYALWRRDRERSEPPSPPADPALGTPDQPLGDDPSPQKD